MPGLFPEQILNGSQCDRDSYHRIPEQGMSLAEPFDELLEAGLSIGEKEIGDDQDHGDRRDGQSNG